MERIKQIADWQVKQIRDLLKKYPSKEIIIADYTEEEFAELKRGEDYAEYLAIRQIVLNRLREQGIADHVVLHKVDSVKYYRFLAEHGVEHDSKSLAWFADADYHKSQKLKS